MFFYLFFFEDKGTDMGNAIGLIFAAVGLIITMRGMVEKDIAGAKEKISSSAGLQKDYDKVVKYLHTNSEIEKNIVERKTLTGQQTWFIYHPTDKTSGIEITTDGRQFQVRMLKLNKNREWKETVSSQATSTLVWKKLQGFDPILVDI